MNGRVRRSLAVVGCALALGGPGCNERAHDAAPPQTESASSPASAPVDGEAAEATVRLRIVTAQMNITVASFADARAAVEAQTAARKGYVDGAEVQQSGETQYGTLTLQIPAEQLAPAMKAIADVGAVSSESVHAQDVTDQVVDLTARLKSSRALEKRMQSLVESDTSNVGELLEVEKELARVRGDIERMEATKQSLERRVAMSTLTLHISEAVTSPEQAGLGAAAWDVLVRSATLMSDAGRALLLLVIGLLPWSPLLAGGTWLVVRTIRRQRSKALAQRERWMQHHAEWTARYASPTAPSEGQSTTISPETATTAEAASRA